MIRKSTRWNFFSIDQINPKPVLTIPKYLIIFTNDEDIFSNNELDGVL